MDVVLFVNVIAILHFVSVIMPLLRERFSKYDLRK